MYFDEQGRRFDIKKTKDVTAIVANLFSMASKADECQRIKLNFDGIVRRCCRIRMNEILEEERNN